MQRQNKRNIILICAALVITTLIAFEPVRHNDFVSYDDDEYIFENPQVQSGLNKQSALWAFTTTTASNWHPVTWLSHMVDCELFGVRSFWHHLTNLLFHAANTVLVFLVFYSMTGGLWTSVFVAAAFGLHPVHVESVAWAAERKDVLSMFFCMLTMAAYIRYARRPGTGRYLLIILLFCLGLMAKPMLVTLPFVLLLLDFWPLRRFSWLLKSNDSEQPNRVSYHSASTAHLIVEKIPLFILSVISSILTYLVQQHGGAVKELSVKFRIANVPVSYVRYIGKIFLPKSLSVLYPHPGSELPIWQSIAATALLVVISLAILYTGRKRHYLLMGWLWFLGTLIPVIGLVQVGAQAIADRYTYLPAIGIFAIAAWGSNEVFSKWHYRKIALTAAAALIFAMLIGTRSQVKLWKDDMTLYKYSLAVTRNNYIMHTKLGVALAKQDRLEDAIEQYHKALRIEPNSFRAHNNLGIALTKQGNFAEAVTHYRQAVRLEPASDEAYSNWGLLLVEQGQFEQAIEQLQRALELKPDSAEAHNNLGLVLARQGHFDEAISHFTSVLQINPNNFEAYHNLAGVSVKKGELAQAAVNYNKALEINPDFAGAHYNLGDVLLLQGRFEAAIGHFRKALQIAPNFAVVYYKLAFSLHKQGRLEEAYTNYRKALQSNPDDVNVLNNLAWLLSTTESSKIRNPGEAIKLATKACDLTAYKNFSALDTLAVAYAAANRFDEAIQTAEKALKLYQEAGLEKEAGDLQNRLELFRKGQPYYEQP